MINKHLPHKTGCKLGCIIHNYLIINIYCGAGGSFLTVSIPNMSADSMKAVLTGVLTDR